MSGSPAIRIRFAPKGFAQKQLGSIAALNQLRDLTNFQFPMLNFHRNRIENWELSIGQIL